MTKDIQSAILRACARFIGKKIEPITRQVDDLRTQYAGTINKEQLEELKQAWEDRLSKPEAWLSKELLPTGPKGDPGRDADPVVVPDVVAELLATDGLKALVDLYVAEAVAKHFEINPVPAGEKGDQGDPGKDADPVNVADVAKAMMDDSALATLCDLHATEAVAKHFEANPVQHGKDGQAGEKGDPGDHGEKGDAGRDGRDGLDVKDLLRADGRRLIAVLSDGTTKDLGEYVGKDGEPGRDGADFSEAELDYDGDRGLIIRGKGGELVKRMPIPMDRGYWREGMKSEKADILTCEGNAWIALKDTSAKPCRENDEDWRLFARKGRDGAQGPAGKEYKPPEPVKLGVTNG